MIKRACVCLFFLLLWQNVFAVYTNNFDSMASMNGWDADLHPWDSPDGWSVTNNRLIISRTYTNKNSGYYYVAQTYQNFELTVTFQLYTKSFVVIPFRYHNNNKWYALYLYPGRRPDSMRFVKWTTSGTELALANPSFYIMARKDYCVRLKVLGNNFYAKVWLKSQSEPANWHIQAQDNSITTPGYIGLSMQRSATNLHGDFSNLTIL